MPHAAGLHVRQRLAIASNGSKQNGYHLSQEARCLKVSKTFLSYRAQSLQASASSLDIKVLSSAVSAPVHNVVSSLLSPFPQVSTAVPTTSTLSTQSPKAVPTSVWQHNRRVVDSDSVRPPSQPGAGALPLLSSPPGHGDKTVEVRAVTSTHGHAAAAAAVPFPTATTPTAHAHVHRAPSGYDNDDAEDGADRDDKRDLHARMLVIPITSGKTPPRNYSQ